MRRIGAAVAIAVVAGAALAATAAPWGADGGPRLVGSLEIRPFPGLVAPSGSEGFPIVNPTTRRLYLVRNVAAVQPSAIDVYDLDTLRLIRQVSLGTTTFPTTSPITLVATDVGAAGIPHAVDERGGRLFFPYYRGTASTTLGLAGVVVFDERTMQVTNQLAPPIFGPAGLGKPLGAFWSATEGRLYILGRTSTASDLDPEAKVQPGGFVGLPTTVVIRWNPNITPQASDVLGHVEAVRPVRACRRALPSEATDGGKFQATILSSAREPSVWVACSTANFSFQLVRMDRNQLADPTGLEEVYPGPEKVRSTFLDPVSERIFARYASGGETWWVFDTARRAWLGRIGIPTLPTDLAGGVDPGTGRLYLHYEGVGLARSDARRQDIPQADIFPNISRKANGLPIVFDPPTHRFFLRATRDRYDIYFDEPPLPEPPPDDPDARTTDIEEQEGVTSASFSGVARSYGARALLLGGLWGLWPPDPTTAGRQVLLIAGTACGPREREVAVGLVEETSLAPSQASARAHAIRTDDATKQDLGAPSRCDPNPYYDQAPIINNRYPGMQSLPDPNPPPGERSNFARFVDRQGRSVIDPDTLLVSTECSEDQGTRRAAARQPTAGQPFGSAPPPLAELLRGVSVHDLQAEVTCEQSKGNAGASGGGPGLEIAPTAGLPGIKVASASSETRLFRDPRRGLVAQSHAIARGIAIGDTPSGAPLVSIDAVESWAEASANGRKKSAVRQDTAVARFIRRISGVVVRNPDGEAVFTCEDCARDLLAVQQQINQALAGRAEIRFPMPDPRLITGTPGGYQAAVQKDEFALRADTALNNDPSFQVPGIEIVSTNDDARLRARQIVQLAGVAAASSYGIFLLGGFGPIVAEPPSEPLPPGTEVASSDLAGTTVFESAPSGPPPTLGAAVPETGALPTRVARQVARSAALLVRRPREGMLVASVWLAFLVPAYAFVRRRHLVRSLTSS